MENTKTAHAQKITSLKKRVKRLEKKGGSGTHKLKRLYKIGRSARVVFSEEASLGDQEDASKQGRKINDIDADAEITLVDESQGRPNDDLMFDIGVLNDEEVFAGHDMAEKEVSTADPITTVGEVVESARPRQKVVVRQEPSDSSQNTTSTIPSKDRDIGKVETDYELGSRPAKLRNKGRVIPDKEEVAVDAIPLATKPPSIVDWKIIKEGKIGYYQIIRADGNSKRRYSMEESTWKQSVDLEII
ncbi:hypothetical protein Tco_0154300 [Tanacetum coccineum]